MIKGRLRRLRGLFVPALLFFAVLAVHGSNLSRLHRSPTGDEPHYLLTAISIDEDRSFDTSDEYREKGWRKFGPYETLDRHCTPEPNGKCLMNHNLWFSALISVPWAIWGLRGVEWFQIVLLALTVAIMAAIVQGFAGGPSLIIAHVFVLAFAFTGPAYANSIAIFPSNLGALILVTSLALLTLYVRHQRRWLLSAVLVTLLTSCFFHNAFIPPALAGAGIVALTSRKDISWRHAIYLISMVALWLVLPYLAGGDFRTGTAASGFSPETFQSQISYHVSDSAQGLITNAPFTIAYAMFGGWIFLKRRSIETDLRVLLLATTVTGGVWFLYTMSFQQPGESPMVRYFMPILPLMMLAIAFMATRSISFFILSAATLIPSIVIGLAVSRSRCYSTSCHAWITELVDQWLGGWSPYSVVFGPSLVLTLVFLIAIAGPPLLLTMLQLRRG